MTSPVRCLLEKYDTNCSLVMALCSLNKGATVLGIVQNLETSYNLS